MSIATAIDHDLRSSHAATSSTVLRLIPMVFVIEDDVSIRDSLESLIRCSGWQAETFATAEEFLCRPPALGPSCLVLDVTLPGLKGIDLQKRFAADLIDMPIVLIKGYEEVLMTVQPMTAGTVEFLTRPFGDDDLLSAIQHALACSEATLRYEAEMRAIRGRHTTLSRREQEVMALVVTGLMNKQVGGELGISEITVKAHRGKVMRKMKARSLADLIIMAASLGLTSDQQAGAPVTPDGSLRQLLTIPKYRRYHRPIDSIAALSPDHGRRRALRSR